MKKASYQELLDKINGLLKVYLNYDLLSGYEIKQDKIIVYLKSKKDSLFININKNNASFINEVECSENVIKRIVCSDIVHVIDLKNMNKLFYKNKDIEVCLENFKIHFLDYLTNSFSLITNHVRKEIK